MSAPDSLRHRRPSRDLAELHARHSAESLAAPEDKKDKAVVMLKDNRSKWQSIWTRFVLGCAMTGSFAFLVYLGHLALTVLVFGLQIKAFHEIISIGWVRYRHKRLPLFRTLNWYFVFAANYYLYGEGFGHYYAEQFVGQPVANAVKHHRFISFCLYVFGFVSFVLCLKKTHYTFQFSQFGFTHLCILLVVVQSHLIVQNIHKGLIWYLVPASIVICNDVMAYMFGFFFGRTPLIKLSPKKTWEGFLGAFVSSLFFAAAVSTMCLDSKFLLCPVESLSLVSNEISCDIDPVFKWTTVAIPHYVQGSLEQLGLEAETVTYLPFMLHSLVFAVFASLIAPFGGFFASGFKRAFEIKDFDDLIPGHGGVVDRMDCQLGMATFVNVYHSSWVQTLNVDHILIGLFSLSAQDQLMVLQRLNNSLVARGILG